VYKLLTHYARGGETVIPATSDFNGLGVYAVREGTNTLNLLVINKNRTSTLNANVTLSGFAPAPDAQLYRYGIPQDEAARTGAGSADVESGSMVIPSPNFVYGAPPYSATVIKFKTNPATELSLKYNGFVLNRRTNRVVQTVSVKNKGTEPIVGPIYLALDGLSSNTALANAAGATSRTLPTGSPYVLVTQSGLAPNASATVALEFMPPSSGGITYTARAIVITGQP
jgi:hypothetical protein